MFFVFFLSSPVYKPKEASSVCRQILAHALRNQEREVNTRSGIKGKNFVQVCEKIFWHVIYCANPTPKLGSRSGSLTHKGLGRQAPWIIQDYDLSG